MIAAAGMATTSTTDRPTSTRNAMTMPMIMVSGAVIIIVQVITTSICTCWTSLVMRVMSDGAPKRPTSRAEKPVTRWNRSRRRSRPKLIATFAPNHTPAMAKTICTSVNASMTRPVRRM